MATIRYKDRRKIAAELAGALAPEFKSEGTTWMRENFATIKPRIEALIAPATRAIMSDSDHTTLVVDAWSMLRDCVTYQSQVFVYVRRFVEHGRNDKVIEHLAMTDAIDLESVKPQPYCGQELSQPLTPSRTACYEVCRACLRKAASAGLSDPWLALAVDANEARDSKARRLRDDLTERREREHSPVAAMDELVLIDLGESPDAAVTMIARVIDRRWIGTPTWEYRVRYMNPWGGMKIHKPWLAASKVRAATGDALAEALRIATCYADTFVTTDKLRAERHASAGV